MNFKFSLLLVFLFAMFASARCQEHDIFHIDGSDTGYFDFFSNIPKSTTGEPIILDGVFVMRRTWKKGVADGTYYVYAISNRDTISYEIIEVKDTKGVGAIHTYQYRPNEYYRKGDLTSKYLMNDSIYVYKEYYQYCDYEAVPVWSEKQFYSYWNATVTLVKSPGDIIVDRRECDANGAEVLRTISVLRADTLYRLYENAYPEFKEGYLCRYYFLNQNCPVEKELEVKNGKLIEKRWCPSGKLYYHTEREMTFQPDGTWSSMGATTSIVDLRSPQHLEDVFFYFHCR
jgi:hypothetical protein